MLAGSAWVKGTSSMAGHPFCSGEFAWLESSIGGRSNSPSPLDKVLTLKDSGGCVN